MIPVRDLGGVARHVIDTLSVGVPGWSLTVAAPKGPLLDILGQAGHSTRALEIGPGVPAPTAVRNLRGLLVAEKPDLAHSHLARADLLLSAAGLGLQLPLVSTEHGIAADPLLYNPNRLVASAKTLLHRIRCRRFTRIIAVSASTREQVLQQWHPRCPVPVILNGHDQASHQRQASGLRFLTLSRLSPEKRLDLAIEAFAQVHKAHPSATLTVAGAGPLLETLQAQARSLGLGQSVTFPGHVDATEALGSHDVLLQLSTWENCSYALLDAVGAGLGVVATPVGGNPEILPANCLTPPAPAATVAAAMIEQATQAGDRPSLPPGWPSVRDMTAEIAHVYGEVTR